MAPHSSTFAWEIPWTEEPGRLHTVHWAAKSRTLLSNFTFTFHFHALENIIGTEPPPFPLDNLFYQRILVDRKPKLPIKLLCT